MKNLIYLIVAVIIAFISCSKDNDVITPVTTASLSINPLVSVSPGTRAVISDFPNLSEIGLFITSGNLNSNYNNTASNNNVKSKLSAGTWTQTPLVYLSPAPATVYAYYPYALGNTNATAIPLEHNTQTDYLYGTHATGQPTINSSNPGVNLTMKHALSLLVFKIQKVNYTGAGTLTKIEVANAAGKTLLSSEATLDIQFGTISQATGKNLPAILSTSYTIPATLPTNENTCPKLLVMPLNISVSTLGNILINFTIDGKVYTHKLIVGTLWLSGTKNIYTVTLNGTELSVGNVGIQNWDNGSIGTADLK